MKYHEFALIAIFAVVLALTAPAAEMQGGVKDHRCDGMNCHTLRGNNAKSSTR